MCRNASRRGVRDEQKDLLNICADSHGDLLSICASYNSLALVHLVAKSLLTRLCRALKMSDYKCCVVVTFIHRAICARYENKLQALRSSLFEATGGKAAAEERARQLSAARREADDRLERAIQKVRLGAIYNVFWVSYIAHHVAAKIFANSTSERPTIGIFRAALLLGASKSLTSVCICLS